MQNFFNVSLALSSVAFILNKFSSNNNFKVCRMEKTSTKSYKQLNVSWALCNVLEYKDRNNDDMDLTPKNYAVC